jgi:diacylglycerol kinase (ATP)
MWMSKVLKSFHHALEGLKYTLVTQRNMRVHFLTALAVLFLSWYLPIPKTEVLVLFVAIILVLFAELINTAVEAVVDMITVEHHPLAKIAKDVTAGAVLLTAGLAVIIGISVFYPYLNHLFVGFVGRPSYPPHIGLATIIAFDFFLTLMLKGWFHRLGRKDWEPSMTTSVFFCVATLIVIVIGKLIITLLIYLLMAILLGSRFRLKPNSTSIYFGAILGTWVAVIGIYLLH